MADVTAGVAPSPKLCTYCGVVIDSGAACATDADFNHCPNKQIGAHVSGVPVGGGGQGKGGQGGK